MKNDFLGRFQSFINTEFPIIKLGVSCIPDSFLCAEIVSISQKDVLAIQDCVRAIYGATANSHYRKKYLPQSSCWNGLLDEAYSTVTAFDFYITDEGPRLLEINTNAAAGPIVSLLQSYHAGHFQSEYFDRLRLHFEAELIDSGKSISTVKVAIIDEAPETQKTYFEFLIYKALFESWGWQTDIVDAASCEPEKYDLIYNRYCDFLLSQPQSQRLKQAYQDNTICLSPSPNAFVLLSDKSRLIDFSTPGFLPESVRPTIPETQLVTAENADELWQKRKQLFFKPTQAYGSKGVYKGASITRSAFQGIVEGPSLAQAYVTPKTMTVETESGPEEFKYDVRVYTYDGEIELIGARLFQGQVTNFKSPYGGFASMKIV